jgi:Putative zinc-finger
VSCEQARLDLSMAADGELPAGRSGALAGHLATCPACGAFQARLGAIRQRLRFEPVGAVPDIAPQVMAAVRDAAPPALAHHRPVGRVGLRGGPAGGVRGTPEGCLGRTGRLLPSRSKGLLPVAAAFLAGTLVGATFIGLGGRRPTQVALADLPARVVTAQRTLTSLAAEVTLVERGWHPSVPERTFSGRLRYAAPESLDLELADHTAYPSPAWVRNDVTLVVAGARWWTRGPRGCPVEAQPGCTPRAPQVRVIERREPFADATPVPLDLVTPVRSFTPAVPPSGLGTRRFGGRIAVGVATTAAQVAPLLAGLAPAGNLRAVHPADRVQLWLDEQRLVPLALRVVVAGGAERQRWAAAHGYRDPPGQVVLELTLRRVVLNRPLEPGAFPPPPAAVPAEDAGFRDLPVTAAFPGGRAGEGFPDPTWLPAGFGPYRSGEVDGGGPDVAVRTWTDGRAWVKVRATRDWPGGRLFGDLGPLVRPLGLGAGVAYASEDGSRIGLHADSVDLVVTGSLAPADLARVVAGLPPAGRPVPAGWAEAATGTLPAALAAAPDLLVPRGLVGFGAPAVRADGTTITLAYPGPGARGFLLVQARGDRLAPPLDADVRGVRVRGSDGRWSAARGELEWVEGGRTVSLRSATLSLEELLAVADRLERP